MAETVQLPAVGKVNKTYVYAGGAAVAGIVGYAWWTRSRRPAAPVYDVDSVGESEYRAPMGGGTNSSYTGQQPDGINTNTQWAKAAVEMLNQGGTDFGLAGIAVSRFLLRQPLEENEARAVTSVLGPLGEPPEGRPWKVIEKPKDARRRTANLSRFAPIPGAPWYTITAQPGESWEQLVLRAYGAKSPADLSYFDNIVASFKEINDHVTGLPQGGESIAFR